ncbi:unnamed protein product [Auanema sp. JU1783]|nr:unnamed protein product [Auanema sp. JU1783]
MDLPQVRVSRGRSVELDGRRINAVSPMHLGESVLQNLIKEKQSQQQQQQQQNHQTTVQDESSKMTKTDDNEMKLMKMIEKYQSQVKLQQQRNPSQASSRNNLHKIEKIANSRPPNGIPPSHMSHSQPCLIAITDKPPDYSVTQPMSSHQYQRRSSGSGSSDQHEGLGNGLANQRANNNQKLLQSIRDQNVQLKREVDTLKHKLIKLQQIETAYERIEREYDVLLREKERQEGLEMTTLTQMERYIRRILAERDMLQERLDQVQNSLPNMQMQRVTVDKYSQLNSLLNEVLPQNEELKACNERQRLEMNAQSATLEEQRNHISMLEKALTNAQDRLSKKDEAVEELRSSHERSKMLQRQLKEVLIDKQSRDEAHAQERAQWEMEITQLRLQVNKDASLNGSLKRSNGARSSVDSGDEAVTRLKKSLYARDERITHLEKTIMELQGKLHDETERKKVALGALSDNLESKIKRLEEEKTEKDRKIAVLTEEKEKLGDFLDESRGTHLLFATSRDDGGNRDLEMIGQKIQERRRKGRLGPTGGLIGMTGDHSRSSSGSLLQTSHQRTSSIGGARDSNLLNDNTLLPEAGYTSKSYVEHNGNSDFTTKISFRGEKREDENGDSVWNV